MTYCQSQELDPYPDGDLNPTQPIDIENAAEKEEVATLELTPTVSLSPEKIARIRNFQSPGELNISTDTSDLECHVRCQCGWEGKETAMVSQPLLLARAGGSIDYRYDVLSASSTNTRDAMDSRMPRIKRSLMFMPVISAYWSRMIPKFFATWAVLFF